MITDGACSGLLARAALRCAEYNVRINLGLTKDEAWNAQAAAELKQLLAEAETLENRLLGKVAEWLKALVLKTSEGASLPWVRIPPFPPLKNYNRVLQFR